MHFGRTDRLGCAVRHAQLNRCRSSDVTWDYKTRGNQTFVAISNVSHGRRNEGTYLERQKLAGELFLHTAIPGRARKLKICLIQEGQKIHLPIKDHADIQRRYNWNWVGNGWSPAAREEIVV
ncbi:hypothetical protein ATANTOWER_024457 [Ataeniobius toweri]|uniref:Uncharacterized protein n=1 Tax=Ataeniobius toweri TaxID=208326 RepID=A0ABU7CB80_9TELE|nr:hypothetical protein [Ataeniobius toweri]